MGIIEKFFPAKAAISSSSIRAEIDRCESEITEIHAKVSLARSGIALLTDAEHQAVEQNIAAMERSIKRLDARIAHLTDELPAILAAEEAQAVAERDAALIKRASAARKANEKEAAKLLAEYADHANAISNALVKLKAMDAEREAVNAELRARPIAEAVESYNKILRKTPDQPATERRETVPHWVYRDASPQPGEVHPGEIEEAVRCTLDSEGRPLHPAGVRFGRGGNILTPQLEMREVVVARQAYRPGRYEDSLDSVRLPPAFTGSYVWPRS
jgi:hypothetical protein